MKKLLSALLSVILLLGLALPIPALADGPRNYLAATAGGSVAWEEAASGGAAKIGTVSAGSTIEFAGYYELAAGSTVNLTATPESGYTFAGWYTQWNSTSPTLVSSGAAYSWTLPTDAGTTLTAAFETAPADTTVYMGLGVTTGGSVMGGWSSSGDTAIIGGTGNYSFRDAGTISLTATADSGYTFKGWYSGVFGSSSFVESNDGTLLSSDNTYTFSAAAGSSSAIQAVFESAAPTPIPAVTVNVTPPAAGTTVGSAYYGVSVPADANYSVTGLAFYDHDPSTDDNPVPPIPDPATFPAGYTFYLLVSLIANDGYMFQQASPYTTVNVTGATLTSGDYLSVMNVSGLGSYGSCVVSFMIPATGVADAYVDNTVDNSVSYVTGMVHITGTGGTQAGYDTDGTGKTVYSNQANVT